MMSPERVQRELAQREADLAAGIVTKLQQGLFPPSHQTENSGQSPWLAYRIPASLAKQLHDPGLLGELEFAAGIAVLEPDGCPDLPPETLSRRQFERLLQALEYGEVPA